MFDYLADGVMIIAPIFIGLVLLFIAHEEPILLVILIAFFALCFIVGFIYNKIKK